MALHLIAILLTSVAAVTGNENETSEWQDTISFEVPKTPWDTPEHETTYFGGLSPTMCILLYIILIFIVIALVSLVIWYRQRNKKTIYTIQL